MSWVMTHMAEPQSGTESLIEALQNGDGLVRMYAARTLGRAREPRAIGPLIAALYSDNTQLQLEAARSLARIGKPAVAALIATLRHESPQVWKLAAAALVKIGRPAVSRLLQALEREDETARVLIIEILAQIGDPSAIPAYMHALASPDRAVVTAAALALARSGHDAVNPLLIAAHNFQNRTIQRHAVEVLKALGEVSVAPLLELMRIGTDLERNQAAWILGRIGKPAVPGLLEALQHADARVRYAAAWSLGYTRSRAAVPALTLLLSDEAHTPAGMRVCDAAAKALEMIASTRALEQVRDWRRNQNRQD